MLWEAAKSASIWDIRGQKHSGSAFVTFVMFRASNVVWLDAKPAVYESSPGVERGFCPTCGSTLTFARPDRDEMNVLAGSLDNSNGG